MSELGKDMLPKEPTCIVACSRSEARLWKSTSRFSDWQELAHLENPDAAKREADFASDRPGRSFDSFGSGRHAMGHKRSGREEDLLRFAGEIADRIDRLLASGEFKHLVLIAEPRFLGYLRDKLSDPAADAVVLEAAKNLVKLGVADIRKYFQQKNARR